MSDALEIHTVVIFVILQYPRVACRGFGGVVRGRKIHSALKSCPQVEYDLDHPAYLALRILRIPPDCCRDSVVYIAYCNLQCDECVNERIPTNDKTNAYDYFSPYL